MFFVFLLNEKYNVVSAYNRCTHYNDWIGHIRCDDYVKVCFIRSKYTYTTVVTVVTLKYRHNRYNGYVRSKNILD